MALHWIVWAASFHDCIRIQVEATQVEVDCRPESVPVAETSRVSLELLDRGIEAFGSGVGGPGHHGGDDAVEVLFDHPG